jgi:UDP-glucose 4-epimerase
MSKRKILLLGGAGFIGYHLSRFLTEADECQLTIADNFSRGKYDPELQEFANSTNTRIVEGDFTQPESFTTLGEYDQVYMLASVVGVDNANSYPHEIIRINTALIFNTLEWLRRQPCKKVLFTSTSECYAGAVEAFNFTVPTPESVPLCVQNIGHPRFTYAITKMLGESGFLNYARALGFETTIVRYHNVFGPRMGFKHVIPHLAVRFRSGENPFKIFGHDQTRAFNYVSDAVRGTYLAMTKPNTNGEIFHIGADDEITIEQLTRAAGDFFGYKGVYEFAPTYPGSVSRRCPDITKARTILGYEPLTTWQKGLELTLSWYRQYLDSGKAVYE